jgi:hypothetical protein
LFNHLSHSTVMSLQLLLRAGQTGITNSSVAQPCAYTSQALGLAVLAAARLTTINMTGAACRRAKVS